MVKYNPMGGIMSQNTEKLQKTVFNTQLKRKKTAFGGNSGNYIKNQPKITAFMCF